MPSFATRATIHAAPDAIWGLLTDASGYASWNSTVTRVDGRIALGETITVHVRVSPGRAFPVKVATCDAPKCMVWRSGLPLGLFKGERTFELPSTGSDTVEFSMREDYTGLLAPLITKSIPNLQPAFDEFAACLKTRAERADRADGVHDDVSHRRYMMKTVLVRYKTHADKAEENKALIHAVFDELRTSAPRGLRYESFTLPDGVSFVHYAVVDTADGSNPLVTLDSFKRFQAGLKERCVELPVAVDLTPVDAYGVSGKNSD